LIATILKALVATQRRGVERSGITHATLHAMAELKPRGRLKDREVSQTPASLSPIEATVITLQKGIAEGIAIGAVRAECGIVSRSVVEGGVPFGLVVSAPIGVAHSCIGAHPEAFVCGSFYER
jgi:hypothetical protein